MRNFHVRSDTMQDRTGFEICRVLTMQEILEVIRVVLAEIYEMQVVYF